ncbi:EamA family transporter [Prauserella rugosa]|uniref:EamA-like transporter family protein n=1 Tax=Prauserella rugosa TaxID=43354 RepID=A0A660C4M5_9PSEU|nr:EamA family transporter [Prauserella rugosa]KMS88378.1 multidrug DMT transporter permease [Streptomyces regensis]TWH18452.1 EamA-like transporter family protein [Prauserella rugosa]
MTATALPLVVAAAFVHAGWNLAAKRVPGGGARFVFLYYAVSAALLVPIAAVVVPVAGWSLSGTWVLAMVGTAVFHVAYGVVLQRGYAVGDLSVVYPVARGSGPLLSVAIAVLVLGERPGAVGLVGAALVVLGVFVIGTGSSTGSTNTAATDGGIARRAGIVWGVLTGVTIAAYTLWDAFSVTTLDVPVVAYLAGGSALQALLLAPVAGRDRSDTGRLWREHRREVVLVGLLSPVAYVLVLLAMRIAPVSMVAPARELGIVVGGLAAWRMFGEPDPLRRILGSLVVLAGITAIALA